MHSLPLSSVLILGGQWPGCVLGVLSTRSLGLYSTVNKSKSLLCLSSRQAFVWLRPLYVELKTKYSWTPLMASSRTDSACLGCQAVPLLLPATGGAAPSAPPLPAGAFSVAHPGHAPGDAPSVRAPVEGWLVLEQGGEQRGAGLASAAVAAAHPGSAAQPERSPSAPVEGWLAQQQNWEQGGASLGSTAVPVAHPGSSIHTGTAARPGHAPSAPGADWLAHPQGHRRLEQSGEMGRMSVSVSPGSQQRCAAVAWEVRRELHLIPLANKVQNTAPVAFRL